MLSLFMSHNQRQNKCHVLLNFFLLTASAKKMTATWTRKKHTSGKNRGYCSWGSKPTRQSLVCSDFQINSEWAQHVLWPQSSFCCSSAHLSNKDPSQTVNLPKATVRNMHTSHLLPTGDHDGERTGGEVGIWFLNWGTDWCFKTKSEQDP